MHQDMDQFTSSPISETINEFIKFLLSAGSRNSKVVRVRVNFDLYNMIVHASVQLNESMSEFIKKAIIERLMRLGIIKVSQSADHGIIQHIITSHFDTLSRKNVKKSRKRDLLRKVEEITKEQKLKEIKKEYKEIKASFTNFTKNLVKGDKVVYYMPNNLQQSSILRERIEALVNEIKNLVKKYDIEDEEYNDLERILDELIMMYRTLLSYYNF